MLCSLSFRGRKYIILLFPSSCCFSDLFLPFRSFTIVLRCDFLYFYYMWDLYNHWNSWLSIFYGYENSLHLSHILLWHILNYKITHLLYFFPWWYYISHTLVCISHPPFSLYAIVWIFLIDILSRWIIFWVFFGPISTSLLKEV